MELEEFPLAAVEFQILRKDYPTSPRVEDAAFEEGIAYFEEVGRIQRDITGAVEAREHFREFARQYPGSRHLEAVRDLVTIRLVHRTEDDLVQVDIGTNT